MQNHKPPHEPSAAPNGGVIATRWEYQVTTVIGGTSVLRAELDTAGAAGFELVSCEFYKGQRAGWVVVLKRPAGPVPS